MPFCPAALPLSSRTVVFTAGVIRRHRARIGSPWRKLNPTEQVLLVLAYLRKEETFADLAAGFGLGTATPAAAGPGGAAVEPSCWMQRHGSRIGPYSAAVGVRDRRKTSPMTSPGIVSLFQHHAVSGRLVGLRKGGRQVLHRLRA
jgi:hypothetical protein